MIQMLAYITDADRTYTWADVKPARMASRPPEYLKALAEENDAWNERDVLVELQLAGHNVDTDMDAIERKIKDIQTKLGRMYYMLNLRPITEIEIARSDALDAGVE